MSVLARPEKPSIEPGAAAAGDQDQNGLLVQNVDNNGGCTKILASEEPKQLRAPSADPMLQAQSSKRRHSTDEEPSLPVETGNEESFPFRPAKSTRMTEADSCASGVQNGAVFCKSSALAIWREDSYRHPGCGSLANAVCIDFAVLAQVNQFDHSSRQAAQRIDSAQPFRRREANPAEVREVLRGCPCSFTQSFHESWEDWTYHTGFECTLEEFLSYFYVDKLNEAMERFQANRVSKPPRHHEIVRIGGKDVIIID